MIREHSNVKMNIFQVHSTKAFVLCKRGGTKKEIDPEIAVYLGTIFILCKGVLRLFRTTHSNKYLRTFSLHKVSKKLPFSEPMWSACHKKRYLLCVELTNFGIFTKPFPIFFKTSKTETATQGRDS